MKIGTTIIKATFLATSIFWLVIISKDFFKGDVALYILLSIIPICICCALTVTLTIAPFFWSKPETSDNSTVFKTYFPYYTIVCFSLCFYGFIEVPEILCFWATAFFTALQSWVWIATDNEKAP